MKTTWYCPLNLVRLDLFSANRNASFKQSVSGAAESDFLNVLCGEVVERWIPSDAYCTQTGKHYLKISCSNLIGWQQFNIQQLRCTSLPGNKIMLI